MMNMEELKLIAETIGKLGEAGQSAFGWWLLADKVLPTICWTIVPAIIGIATYKTFKLFIEPEEKLPPLTEACEAVRAAWLRGKTGHEAELYDMYERLEQLAKEKK